MKQLIILSGLLFGILYSNPVVGMSEDKALKVFERDMFSKYHATKPTIMILYRSSNTLGKHSITAFINVDPKYKKTLAFSFIDLDNSPDLVEAMGFQRMNIPVTIVILNKRIFTKYVGPLNRKGLHSLLDALLKMQPFKVI